MSSNFRSHTKKILLAAGCLACSLAQAATTDLSDQPLFTSQPVAGNLMLALSVEYPTADSTAYPTTAAYSTGTEYVGYFDPAKCYTFIGGAGSTATGASEVASNNSTTLN
ncbi:MAG: hypothetical protein ACRETW_11915, partial [Stenotrophobium sp.]